MIFTIPRMRYAVSCQFIFMREGAHRAFPISSVAPCFVHLHFFLLPLLLPRPLTSTPLPLRLVVRGTYNISGDSPASQNYPTEPSSRAAQQGADPSSQSQPQQPYQQPVQFVSVRILSNHGHDKYTCLYRIRAHGRPAAV
jgi:hypothetical protein